MNNTPYFNQDIKDKMNVIEMSYLFAKNSLDSKKLINNLQEWSVFEPTKFMYLYQTFNMLYDYDWSKLQLINGSEKKYGFKTEINNKNGKYNYYIKAEDKILKLNKFIRKISNDEMDEIFKKELFTVDNLSIVEKFKSIKKEIGSEHKRINKLVKIVKKLPYEDNWQSSKNENYIESTILYLNYIRNNLFHGSKQIDSLIKKTQIERFIFYNKILEIYIDIFFITIQKVYKYKRLTIDDLIYTLNR